MSVLYPSMRDEVRTAFEYLADRDYQDRIWTGREPYRGGPHLDWDTVVRILYDDHELDRDPSRKIGVLFRDQREVAAVARVMSALDRVFDEVGDPDAEISAVLNAPSWPAVVEGASEAARTLASDRTPRNH